MTKTSSFRAWLNKVIDVKRKFVLMVAAITIVLVLSFQYQTSAISDARVQDVEANATQVCEQRVETRETVREILFYVVDLSDVLPGVPDAEQYTANRRAFINAKYPELNKDDC